MIKMQNKITGNKKMDEKVFVDDIIHELELRLKNIDEQLIPVGELKEKLNNLKGPISLLKLLGAPTRDYEMFVKKEEEGIKNLLDTKRKYSKLLEKARELKSRGIEYVPAIAPTILPIDMAIPTGFISATNPPGYGIYVDNIFQNSVTPITLSNIPVGRHKVTFGHRGLPKYTLYVDVVAGVITEARL